VNLPERLSFACVLRTVLGVCLPWLLLAPAGASDLVGVGMSDVTGEAADVGMFGYAHVTLRASTSACVPAPSWWKTRAATTPS
jgi:hypothetical protein